MSEESTQTNVSALEEDAGEEPRVRQHPLPWILFGFTVVVLALVGGLLAKRLSSEKQRANEAIEKSAGFKAQLEQLQKSQGEVDKKVADADAKVKEAEEAAAAATAKLKTVEGERDKLQKELEAAAKKGETAKAEPAGSKSKTAAKKTKAKKKKKRG